MDLLTGAWSAVLYLELEEVQQVLQSLNVTLIILEERITV